MARKPRANKDKNPGTAPLLAALKFIAPASREIGQPNQTHCMLAGQWAVAFDGVLCMAAKIDNDIVANPNTSKLLAALSHCDETTQITQLDNQRLSIKSGKYRAIIPCLEPGALTVLPPDKGDYPIDDRVKQSLEIVGKVAKENAPRMVAASILLQNGSAVATDGILLFEHWHGWQLPSVILPKTLVNELSKITKKLALFGVSKNSATFWFEDNSFIRSQLYTEPYPDLDTVNVSNDQQPIPEGFFTALDKLDALKGDNKAVLFTNTSIRTHMGEEGASYDIEGLPPDLVFNLDYLRMIGPHAKTADFNVNDKMAVFYGDNFRAFLMHMRSNVVHGAEQHDDDIPY